MGMAGFVERFRNAVHVMRPTLISLAFMALESVAHALGAMDFSGADTLMPTFKNFAVSQEP